MDTRSRSGQSLIELLVGIAVGAIFMVGAASIIVPSLKVSTQAGTVQMQAQLGQELLDNVRAWANGNWGGVLALATGTANRYYLNTATSPFAAVGTSTTGESVSGCSAVSSPYSYSRTITIDHTKVPNTDQTNFPVLFSGTYPYLATTGNGGNVANANGYDIIFTSDSAGNNILPFEQESYSSSTGAVNYWINVPTVSHTANTVIYMWYGDPNITTSQANPAGVWGSTYAGVYHFPNGTTLSAGDSTANNNNGSIGAGVSATGGVVDGGASFNGASTAVISPPSVSSAWNFPGNVTVSAWVKTTSNGMIILQLQNSNPLIYLEVGPSTVGGASNKAVAYFRTNAGGVLVASGNTTINDGNWHYITVVRNTGSNVIIYVDGVADSTTSYTDSGAIDTSGGAINIGNSAYSFNGGLDEVRISNVARSADWIATEYANQSSPGTFYSIGSAVSSPSSTTSQTCATYSRFFYLTDIYRDVSGNIATATSGNYYDPSTKLVTVSVGIASSTVPPLVYSEYITRSGNNALSQATWAGGSGQNGPVTFVSSTYSTATSVTVNATGSLSLSAGPAPGGACYYSNLVVSSLAGYWPLDEGSGTIAYDSGANGNNGTWYGTQSSPSGTYYTAGKVGPYAGYFDGTDNYLQSPNLSAINSNTSTLSVALWFNPVAAGVVLSETGQTSVNTGWHDSWIEILSGKNVDTRIWNCSALVAGTGAFNSWNYVVLTYDGTTLKSYLNGVAGASESCSRTSPGASGKGEYLSFGATDGTNMGSGAWFHGAIDDARVYPRALSASEVSTLYSGGTVN